MSGLARSKPALPGSEGRFEPTWGGTMCLPYLWSSSGILHPATGCGLAAPIAAPIQVKKRRNPRAAPDPPAHAEGLHTRCGGRAPDTPESNSLRRRRCRISTRTEVNRLNLWISPEHLSRPAQIQEGRRLFHRSPSFFCAQNYSPIRADRAEGLRAYGSKPMGTTGVGMDFRRSQRQAGASTASRVGITA